MAFDILNLEFINSNADANLIKQSLMAKFYKFHLGFASFNEKRHMASHARSCQYQCIPVSVHTQHLTTISQTFQELWSVSITDLGRECW